jgi:cytosine permease
MVVDYFLAGRKWSGPRAGFNPAGWIAWLLGFIVGILDNEMLPEGIRLKVHYCSPVAAFIVGAVVYFICAKAGLLSKVVPLPEKPAPEPAPAPAST